MGNICPCLRQRDGNEHKFTSLSEEHSRSKSNSVKRKSTSFAASTSSSTRGTVTSPSRSASRSNLRASLIMRNENDFAQNAEEEQPLNAEIDSGFADLKRLSQQFSERIKDPNSGLAIKDRVLNLKVHKRCFVGSELVDWIMRDNPSEFDTREKATEYAQSLLEKGIFSHVTKQHQFKDEQIYYKLQEDEDAKLLNKKILFRGTARKSTAIGVYLRKQVLRIYANMLTSASDDVVSIFTPEEVSKVRKSQQFIDFELDTAELQQAQLEDLTEDERKAFWLNIYNVLLFHGVVLNGGFPKSQLQRSSFFTKTAYEVAGHSFSIGEIFHGILRGNRHTPGTVVRKVFKPNDPRIAFMLSELDPRVHFAKTIPKCYYACAIDTQLQSVSEEFCRREVVVSETDNKIIISKLFSTFSDFGEDNASILRYVADFLDDAKKERLLELLQYNYIVKFSNSGNWDWERDTLEDEGDIEDEASQHQDTAKNTDYEEYDSDEDEEHETERLHNTGDNNN